MKEILDYPLSIFIKALQSVLGTVILFVLSYIFGTLIGMLLGGCFIPEIIPFVIILISFSTGWGIIVYLFLAISLIALFRTESSRVKSIILFSCFFISLLDSWRIFAFFDK